MHQIRVLHPSSAWGGAHVQTCINILKGMQLAGANVHLHLIRTKVDMGGLSYTETVPRSVNRFAMVRFERFFAAQCEKKFLAKLQPNEMAWLWPGVSTEVFEAVRARGNPIIMEGINTRRMYARDILDAAYRTAGLPSRHGITDAKIEEEEYQLSMASYFFSPSPCVAHALSAPDSAFAGQAMQTSYGMWMRKSDLVESRREDDKTRVVFMGSIGIRKNAHTLLRAWSKLQPTNAELVLYGYVDEDVAQICASELALDSVKLLGWTHNVVDAFSVCDIFILPSFEEGDPQVTYDAASCGLPILASPMGGGRLAERSDAVALLDPNDVDQVAATLNDFISDSEKRHSYSERARRSVVSFDWNVVGRERVQLLKKVLNET